MKRSRYEQFAIVHADSASLFQKQLNEEIFRLRDNDPVVKFSESIPFYAQIKYSVDNTTPEKISEEYELQGVQFVCAQCPFFKAPLKEDGTEDKRCKYGDCEHTDLGRTFRNTLACDKLYELIAEGGVKLCFTE
jgi:hypothetical protein